VNVCLELYKGCVFQFEILSLTAEISFFLFFIFGHVLVAREEMVFIE